MKKQVCCWERGKGEKERREGGREREKRGREREGEREGGGVACYLEKEVTLDFHQQTLSSHLSGVVKFIDFEYGGPNYLAYDIANHFCEFAGKAFIFMTQLSNKLFS